MTALGWAILAALISVPVAVGVCLSWWLAMGVMVAEVVAIIWAVSRMGIR